MCCYNIKSALILHFLLRLPLFTASVTVSGATLDEERFSSFYARYLQRIRTLQSPSVHACVDFFQHACSGYMTSTFANDTEQAVPPLLYNQQDRARFFEQQLPHFKSDGGRLLRQLYSECRQLQGYLHKARRQQTQRYWLRLLQEIPFLAEQPEERRVWPYLRLQWQRNTSMHWAPLAAEFAAHGLPIFLHIFFAEQTIYIAPLEQQPHCDADLRALHRSLQPLLLGVRHVQDAHVIVSELQQLCRQLRATHEATVQLGAELETEAGVGAFMRHSIMAPYFARLFARLQLNVTTVANARKVIVSVPRVLRLRLLLEQSNERVLYNYVLWRAYETLTALSGDCYALVEEFEPLWLAELWQWHVFDSYFGRQAVLATWLLHTTRFQQLKRRYFLRNQRWDALLLPKLLPQRGFNLQNWISSYAQAQLLPSVNNLTAAYERELQSFYGSNLDSNNGRQSGSFFAHLLTVRRLQLRATFEQPLPVDVEDAQQPAYFLRHFLYYAILMLHQPLFHYFATQGFQLWADSKLLHSSDGYYTALDCLERQSRLQLDTPETPLIAQLFRLLSEEEVLRLFRFQRTFSAVLDDYRFWLEGEFFAFAEDFILEAFEMDARRIIFYAVTQQFCGRNDELYSSLINRSFMNTPDFQVAFNCTAEDAMNPVVKCLVDQRGFL